MLELIAILARIPTAFKLPSKNGCGTLRGDLWRLGALLEVDDRTANYLLPLLTAIVTRASDEAIWAAVDESAKLASKSCARESTNKTTPAALARREYVRSYPLDGPASPPRSSAGNYSTAATQTEPINHAPQAGPSRRSKTNSSNLRGATQSAHPPVAHSYTSPYPPFGAQPVAGPSSAPQRERPVTTTHNANMKAPVSCKRTIDGRVRVEIEISSDEEEEVEEEEDDDNRGKGKKRAKR